MNIINSNGRSSTVPYDCMEITPGKFSLHMHCPYCNTLCTEKHLKGFFFFFACVSFPFKIHLLGIKDRTAFRMFT